MTWHTREHETSEAPRGLRPGRQTGGRYRHGHSDGRAGSTEAEAGSASQAVEEAALQVVDARLLFAFLQRKPQVVAVLRQRQIEDAQKSVPRRGGAHQRDHGGQVLPQLRVSDIFREPAMQVRLESALLVARYQPPQFVPDTGGKTPVDQVIREPAHQRGSRRGVVGNPPSAQAIQLSVVVGGEKKSDHIWTAEQIAALAA